MSIQVWQKEDRAGSFITCVHASIAKRLRAKFRPDCAIPDTSMKFGTVVDHD